MSLTLPKIHAKCRKRSECRLWTMCCNSSGQPIASDGAKRRGVPLRREVYRLAVGPIPEKHEIIMTCEVDACLEPQHMLALTKKERMQRLSEAGRLSTAAVVQARTNEARARSSFSFEQAEQVRKRALGAKRGDFKTIAVEFGITPWMVSKIVTGKAWKASEEPAPTVKVQRLPGCPIRSRFEPPPWFKGEFSREWEAKRAQNANSFTRAA